MTTMSSGGGEAGRIAEEMRARITSGELPAGARLPGQRALMARYGAADRTVAVALHRLRTEGLVYAVPRGGWFVRPDRGVVRSTRSRLSRAEREAGRGAFSTDCHEAGLTPQVDVVVEVQAADEDVAGELDVAPGSEVLVRARVMRGDGEVLQLATSYLPRGLTEGTAIEQDDTGPGGVYARLEDLGHTLSHYVERVAIGRADEHEARVMALTPGSPVYRVVRTAWSGERAVEVNRITITGDRYELEYRLPAE